MVDQRLLNAILREDLSAFVEKVFATIDPGTCFVDSWLVAAITEALRRIRTGESKRLFINVPPRSGKSTVVTIAFTAFLLGHDPRKRIICVSHSEALAKAHAAAFRTLVNSPWYRALFPRFAIQRGGDRDNETVTTEGGYRYATSLAGSIMGRGAGLIIGDDVMSPDAALSEAVRVRETNQWIAHRTRLNNKAEDAIVLVMQRLHQRDLIGHVQDSETWDSLVVPATAPEPAVYTTGPRPTDIYRRARGEVLHPTREPQHVLDATQRAIGSTAFSAQYQQDPQPPGGHTIKRHWLRFFDEEPEFDFVLASWDLATSQAETSSFSVCTVWGAIGMEFYLRHVLRERLEAPALRRAIVDIEAEWRVDLTLIEQTAFAQYVVQDLRSSRDLRPMLDIPSRDKLARLMAVAPRFEAGQVLLPRQADWLGTYTSELLGFPLTEHNDQVDATSQALRYLTTRQGPLQPETNDRPRREVVRRNLPRANFVIRR